MSLRKIVMNSISWATMGCALTGVAIGQVPDTGIDAAANTDGALIDAKAATEAPVPPAAVDTSANVNVNPQGVEANAGVQSNQNQTGSNATIRNDGVNAGTQLNSNAGAAR
ncbi:MAG TPA: hypothetical protein PK992_09305, partial [Planctomycetaceae bacterium]|nr:hypothetical protein [Planctomycetaceae bacterium]